jgi:hypothetical integral membrane protein (TIGR02206 family)
MVPWVARVNDFFSGEFSGPPFQLFAAPHLFALGSVLAAIGFLVVLRWLKRPDWNRRFRHVLALVLVAQEISFHGWNLHIGHWSIQTMLPLQVCSLFVWLSAYMLATRSARIYEFAFFIGISGALQALLTPDIGAYNYPHYRFFHVFLSHGAILVAALHMTIVENHRPSWAALGRTVLWLNVYTVVVFCINRALGSNYLFLIHKPETASLFDVLGPWPVYILAAEGVALVMFICLYLPFAIRDWRLRQSD